MPGKQVAAAEEIGTTEPVLPRKAEQFFQYLTSLRHGDGFLLMSIMTIVWTTPLAMPSPQSALSVLSSHDIKLIAFCNRIAGDQLDIRNGRQREEMRHEHS
ncbi:hypothetical protein QA648_03210 [Rhizobium sp. CB3171]|uniref:hypothetical protein n=1 Tax=unclassified Rhizobium TaxID=2613769 RepID=UPI00131A4E56|nr:MULTISPECIES: hypothetical protein [Rhizobium]UWU21987.1 hypothetical protein N2601_03125 [Rhizobium tropici]WFU02802.1 hypothetical protein QA648_03210 [Rhizobium sp. CB3171]